jgi:hypothetical protein
MACLPGGKNAGEETVNLAYGMVQSRRFWFRGPAPSRPTGVPLPTRPARASRPGRSGPAGSNRRATWAARSALGELDALNEADQALVGVVVEIAGQPGALRFLALVYGRSMVLHTDLVSDARADSMARRQVSGMRSKGW